MEHTQDCRLRRYLAAAINCSPVLGNKERNVAEQCTLVEEAAKNGAKLIALPELSTTGYCWYSREEIAPFAEPIPGPTTSRFAEIAAAYQCWIVVGLPEVDVGTGVFYNAAALIGPEGVVGVHRKTHSYVSETKWAKQGDLGHQVFDTPIGRIGLLVCMDINFMETARLETVAGADVIVNSSAWVGEKTPGVTWITRAFENGVYVLEADRIGQERGVEFNGGSCLIAPDGQILCNAGGDAGIVYGEIDLDLARQKDFGGVGNKLTERRPELYRDLVTDPYLWNPLVYHGLYGRDPLPAGKRSRISVTQFTPIPGAVEENLRRIETETRALAAEGSELIVFPELALSGFVTSPQEAAAVAETLPGMSSDRLLNLCMRYRVHLVVGMVERDGEQLFNTAALYGPDGLIGTYRKRHLAQLDHGWAAPGNGEWTHFNTPLGRVGILIGHDAMFPETARLLAMRGVDIICCPSAVAVPAPLGLEATSAWHNYPEPSGYSNIQWHLWRVRAGENNCYVAFANADGPLPDGRRCIGRSGIFQPAIWVFPRNEVILSASGEERATLEIDTQNGPDGAEPTGMTRKKYMLGMRQPIWYDALTVKLASGPEKNT